MREIITGMDYDSHTIVHSLKDAASSTYMLVVEYYEWI